MMRKFDRLLDYSERILSLDVRYFSKNSFLLFLRQVVMGLGGFALTFVLARQFSKYTFGEYNLTLALLGILSIFSLPGMMDSILNSVIRGFDKSLVEGTKLRLKSSFLSIPVMLALAYFYFYNQQSTVSLLLLLAAPIFPLFYSFKTYNVFLIAKEKFFDLFIVAFITSIITASAVISTTLIFKKIYLTFLSFILINSLLDVAFYFGIKKDIKKGAKKDLGMRKFGYFISFTVIVSLIVNNLDKAILSFFSGFSALAVFSIANTFPQFVEKTLYSLEGVLIPKIIKQGVKGNQETIRKHLLKTILISALMAFFILLFSPLVIKTFFGRKYQQSIFFSQLLSLQLLFQLPSALLSNIIIYQKRLRQTLFLSFSPGILKMIFYFILIPKFGILGLVLTLVVTRFLNFLALLYFSFKRR